MSKGADTVIHPKARPSPMINKNAAEYSIVSASELNRIKVCTRALKRTCSRRRLIRECGISQFTLKALMRYAESEISMSHAQATEKERAELGESRRERILKIERERTQRQASQLAYEDNSVQRNQTLAKARQALDEQLDPVKKMNQMIAFAKVQTILDIQLEEKRMLQRQQEEEQRAVDMMMEQERLKAISLYEQRERIREEEQKRGAALIVHGIKEKEKRLFVEQEQKVRERLVALKQIEEEAKLEDSKQTEKREAQQKLMADALAVNAAVTKLKEEVKISERIEDMKLLEYQRIKDMKEREREEELMLAAAKREAELARLRSKQERAKDKHVELDALRAKRAMETAERAARERDRKECERRENINRSLMEARKIQQAERRLMLIDRAREEKAEFERVMAIQQQQDSIEKAAFEKDRQRLEMHVKELRNQIKATHEKKAQERQDLLEEGNMVRAQSKQETIRLEKIRKEKIDLMMKSHIPEKHCNNLKNLKLM
jgi:hypothetical protein